MNPLNRLLALVGLKVSRTSHAATPRQDQSHETDVVMRIGNRDLLVPPLSSLLAIYREMPDYMGELGRVASEIYAKYPGMTAVDVGGNIGDTAAIIRSGCPAPIICIEGDQSYARVLAENANRIGGVQVRHQYLSDRRHTQGVVIDKEGWNSTLVPVEAADAHTTIDFFTLDDAIEDVDRRQIKLIKVDTEGFDPRVIRGSRKIVEDGHPVVLFEHNRQNLSAIGDDNLSVFSQLREAGYRAVIFWDAYGRFILGTTLDQTAIVEDLHGYVDFNKVHLGKALYLDVCVFHREDDDIAARCLAVERRTRDRRQW